MKKFCPECQKLGLKSKIWVGASVTTMLAWQPYYDEDGNYHNNNPNKSITQYRCSNGHAWQELGDVVNNF